MKKIVLTLLFITTIFAQDVVSIVTSGDGSTKDQATTAALRNAIEQAYGAFISSNTKFLNDELIQDEITSVAQGNINSYEILNTTSTSNGFFVLVKSELSLKKLEQFGQSFGQFHNDSSNVIYMNISENEMNVLKENFYEKNEYRLIQDYLNFYRNIQLFDYTLDFGTPYRKNKNKTDNEFFDKVSGNNWKYPIEIKITPNNNFRNFYKDLYNHIKNISI